VNKPRPRSDRRTIRQPAGLSSDARVRELTYLGQNSRGFELSKAFYNARERGRLSPEDDELLRERLIWLRTRIDSLKVIGRRLAEEWIAIRAKAVVAPPAEDRYGLMVDRVEAVTLAVDAEELVKVLYATQDAIVAVVKDAERALFPSSDRTGDEDLLAIPGVPEAERELFKQARHGFAHSEAPWLAVVILPDEQVDLAILTRWHPDYANGEGYLLLSQLLRWARGLNRHLDKLEATLSARINALK